MRRIHASLKAFLQTDLLPAALSAWRLKTQGLTAGVVDVPDTALQNWLIWETRALEGQRALAFALNISCIEIAIGWQASEPAGTLLPIIKKCDQNMGNLQNPRTIMEMQLLFPVQEWDILEEVMRGHGVVAERRWPVMRHFQALRRIHPESLKGDWQPAVLQMLAISRAWQGRDELPDGWYRKAIDELGSDSSASRAKTKAALSAVPSQDANDLEQGSLTLAIDAEPLKPGEDIWRLVNRIRYRTADGIRGALIVSKPFEVPEADLPSWGQGRDTRLLSESVADDKGAIDEMVVASLDAAAFVERLRSRLEEQKDADALRLLETRLNNPDIGLEEIRRLYFPATDNASLRAVQARLTYAGRRLATE